MDDVHQLNKGVDERDFFDEDGNNLYGNDTDKADDEELENRHSSDTDDNLNEPPSRLMMASEWYDACSCCNYNTTVNIGLWRMFLMDANDSFISDRCAVDRG